MQKITAQSGWRWIQQGFALFQKQAAQLATLYLANLVLALLLSSLPLLGQFLPLLLAPACNMAILAACARITHNQQIDPGVLLAGFRTPRFPALLQAGLIYALGAWLAIYAASLVDGGQFLALSMAKSTAKPNPADLPKLAKSMLFMAMCFVPFWMALVYAAPLILWQNMSVLKAMFFSFFGILRNFSAFIVFFLGWFVIALVLTQVVTLVIGGLTHSQDAVMLVLLPLLMLLGTVLACSFFPAYTDLFGLPPESMNATQPPAA